MPFIGPTTGRLQVDSVKLLLKLLQNFFEYLDRPNCTPQMMSQATISGEIRTKNTQERESDRSTMRSIWLMHRSEGAFQSFPNLREIKAILLTTLRQVDTLRRACQFRLMILDN